MNNLPLLNDLRVFMLVARRAGFAAVAEELGVSPAFVSKRIALLEQTLNVVLLHRTTRRVTITEEGERIYEWAQRILQDVGQMMDELSDVRQAFPGDAAYYQQLWFWTTGGGSGVISAGEGVSATGITF